MSYLPTALRRLHPATAPHNSSPYCFFPLLIKSSLFKLSFCCCALDLSLLDIAILRLLFFLPTNLLSSILTAFPACLHFWRRVLILFCHSLLLISFFLFHRKRSFNYFDVHYFYSHFPPSSPHYSAYCICLHT